MTKVSIPPMVHALARDLVRAPVRPARVVRLVACGAWLLGGLWPLAHSGAFEDAYRAALDFDAKFQAARAALASSRQAEPLARSSLLPVVQASVSDASVQGTQEYDVAGGSPRTNTLDYRSPSHSLSLRAPLLNAEGDARLRQARAQVSSAHASFAARQAELVDRVATAYLQCMLAEDNFQSLQAQVRATLAQRDLVRRRFEQGEGTRTEVAEARANLSLTTSQWVDAKDQLNSARELLRSITGLGTVVRPRWGDTFAPTPLEPATVADWQSKAEAGNPDVQARRLQVEVAQAQVARSEAGHWPRLDVVASVARNRNEAVSSLNQTLNQTSLGLQLQIPLYNGGAVQAAVTQALADKARAEAEWLQEKRSLEVEVARLVNTIQTGKSKLQAYEDVLDASRTALEGTQKGHASGLRTNADVLEAVRKVHQAQRDLAQVRYDHIYQRLRLFNKAGMPADVVVSSIDEILNPAADRP